LLEKVALGTPHIAGYSLDGKLRGTEMIYRAACEYFGLASQGWHAGDDLPERCALQLDEPGQDVLRAAVFHSYDVRQDDRRLRSIVSLDVDEHPVYFDRLRKEYPVRREFPETPLVANTTGCAAINMLRGIGFNIH
jgi:erythronate-4-phosphate dehydrogenase